MFKDRHPKWKNKKSLCWWVYLTISEHGCIESNLELNPYFAWEFYFSWKQLSKLISKFLNIWLVFSEAEAAGAWKVSKYGVIFGPYFPVFSPNTRKYGPEITPYFDTSALSWCKGQLHHLLNRGILMQS